MATRAISRRFRRAFCAGLLLLVALRSESQEGAPGSASFAITNVTLIDGTGAASRSGMTVRVAGGRITAIEPSRPGRSKPGETVDGSGKFLIPGLWDMHVHLTHAGDLACPTLIANGVTGVRDLGGELELIDWMRARIAAGTLIGPRIFRAGPFVDGSKPGVADRLVIDTAEEGRRAVGFLQRRGVDFIKVHTGAPAAAYLALLQEAQRARLPVVGHVPFSVDAVQAIEAGHSCIEHVVSLFEADVKRKVKAGKTQAEAVAEFTDEAAAALARKMVARGVWFDPTLIAYWTRSFQWDLRAKPDPREKYASASLKESWKKVPPLPDKPDVRALLALAWDRFLELASIVRREQVQFLVGTDLAAPHIYPGFGVHEELEWLVKAGFSPAQVLSAATRNSAEVLGRSEELGTITPGKRADLVLLEANPLEDIRNTRKIATVVADGRLYRKPQLEAMLADVAARADSR